LGPGRAWPGGQADATAAVAWARDRAATLGVDASQIILAGDSAGGHLAAVAALRLADTAPVQGQALIYPTIQPDSPSEGSVKDFAEGFGLTAAEMAFFWHHYLSGQSPRETALMQREDIAASPATFIATAEYDVLRDEGEAFAARLIASGVPTFARRYLGANHNFLAFAGRVPACDAIYTDLSRWIWSLTGDFR